MNVEEIRLLGIYKELLEQKLGWGANTDWSNQEFEALSDKIFEGSGVRLSVTTLKRVAGKVRYEGTFNKATLNALAQHLGYENWNAFAAAHPKITAQEGVRFLRTWQAKRGPFLANVRLKIAVFAAVFIGVLVVLAYKKSDSAFGAKELRSVGFSSQKMTDSLPNSVIFTYDVSGIDADSFFIQQNWDPNRRQRINPHNHTHTSIYYYPGHYNARLIANNEVIKKSKVFIKTQGWKGIIEKEPLPVYLKNEEIKKDSAIGISKETLKEKTGLSVFNNVNTCFFNIRSFDGLKANNFQFETTLKNTSTVDESLCRQVYVYILFNGGTITLPLANRGCISSLFLSTGEKFIDGKDYDLSKFGCDFATYQNLKCRVQNRIMIVTLNDSTIFQQKLADNPAELVGIKISFEGTGLIKSVKLGEPGKVPVLNDRF